jgi:hypothetical protein
MDPICPGNLSFRFAFFTSERDGFIEDGARDKDFLK